MSIRSAKLAIFSGARASRASFAAGAAVAVAGGIRPGRAAEFEFKCASTLPFDHPIVVRTRQMWDAIERESRGRIHTQFFPNSALGSEIGMLTQTRIGAIDFYPCVQGAVGSIVPAADIGSLGFAFRNGDEGLRVMEGPLGAYVRQEIEAKGLHALPAMWNSGMYVVTASGRPIQTPDDLRGFKIRVLDTRILVDLFRTLGATPTTVVTAEMYLALQTKLVDGLTSSIVSVETAKWYEVAKYVSLTNHAWSAFWLIANSTSWGRLPADLQGVVERNNAKYSTLCRGDIAAQAISIADKLRRRGLVLNQVDPAPFRMRLQPYYDAWSSAFGSTAWGLLQSSLGRKLS